MFKKVLIDIGHGGRDPGATFVTGDGQTVHEYDVNAEVGYDILHYLAQVLDQSKIQYIDAGAPDGSNPAYDITTRANHIVEIADAQTLVLSLHMNKGDPSATGAEIIYLDGNTNALNLATAIINDYAAAMNIKNRGAKPDTKTEVGSLAIMRVPKAKKPEIAGNIVLLEMGFVSNDSDVIAVRQNAAYVIACAILKQLGIDAPEQEQQGPYADVSMNHYAAEAIQKMTDAGIMKGFGDGLFRPDEPLTRGQAAIIADRILQAAKTAAPTTSTNPLKYPRKNV